MAESLYDKPAILSGLPRDQHGVLEANAGTGKTHVLAHLFADLLLSTPCELEQILAVTFTERALAELRQRVRQLLEAAKADRRAAAPQRRKLESALVSFSFAPIYTIHSFCHQLLLEFSPDSLGPRSLEVTDSGRAFHRAFRAFLREHLAVEKRFNLLLEGWLTERSVERLEALLFAAHCHRYLESGAAADHRAAVLGLLTMRDIDAVKQDYAAAALEAQARDNAIRALDDLAKLIAGNRADVEALAEKLAGFDFSPLLEPRRVAARSGKRRFPEELSSSGKAFLSAAKKARAAAQIEVRAIDAILPRVAERLEKDKREQGLLDYDDMLRRVWGMLDGPRSEHILPALRARLRYGLIDEFQDTDELQWKILRRIFVESKGGNLLYLIGDPKQAIYAFRGADVFAYLAAVDELTGRQASRLSLNENFRSTAPMVDALNAILDQSAANPLFTGEINYRVASKSARPDFHAVDRRGQPLKPVSLMRYAPEGQGNGSAGRARKALGRHFAENLRRILFDPGHEVRITQENGAPRRVGAEEIFVLTRTAQESVEAGSYLQEAGVPFTFYKLDGLFQTDQARDILDLLKAVERPATRARRLKAYLTPFFGLSLSRLPLDDEVSADPFYETLLEWNALAEQEQLAELFDRVLHQSGLVARELLLSANRRRLANYEQIFETLLERSSANKLALSDLILVLQGYIAGGVSSIEAEQNLQRPEGTRAAVRILTVHKSKGLEAKIVVLFGGFYSRPDDSPISRYHEGRQCRLAVGKYAKDLVKDTLSREHTEEDQRLLYVAITRACAKLYLSFFPDRSLKKPPTGYYAALNRRLNAMASGGQLREDLFALENVLEYEGARPGAAGEGAQEDAAAGTGATGGATTDENGEGAPRAGASAATQGPPPETHASGVAAENSDAGADPRRASDRFPQPPRWSPPQRLLEDEDNRYALRVKLAELRARHAPLAVRSYTSLNRYAEADPQVAAFDRSLEVAGRSEAREAVHELAGSREVGIFLHEAIGGLNLRSLAETGDLDSWKNRADVRETFRRAIRRRWGIDEAAAEPAMRLVYRALRCSFAASGRRIASELYTLASLRETEFLYPVFDFAGPPSPGASGGGREIRPVYFRGFVDLVFEHQGLIYLADWKSDILPSYEPAALKTHVKRHYESQIKIYAVAVIRLLQIGSASEYEKRFGGLLYLFLRGLSGAVGGGLSGVYYRRPAWADIKRYETELADAE